MKDKEKHHQQEMEAKEAQARKELEERDKRHAEVLEAERQTHRMEQAAISGRLKRSNQEVRELKDQIKQLDDLAAKTEVAGLGQDAMNAVSLAFPMQSLMIVLLRSIAFSRVGYSM